MIPKNTPTRLSKYDPPEKRPDVVVVRPQIIQIQQPPQPRPVVRRHPPERDWTDDVLAAMWGIFAAVAMFMFGVWAIVGVVAAIFYGISSFFRILLSPFA